MSPTRILIVDDEPTMLRTVERVLRGEYEVRSTSSPTMALDMAFVFEPHLAILDIRMPEMDGFELMEALKQMDPDIRVILMTGGVYDVDEQLIRAIREEAFYYITKPFDRDVLRALVKRCIELQSLERDNRQYVNELEETLQRLKETQGQLIQAEKMASLGRFATGIAHEIKNPLNFVNNFSHLMIGLVEDLGGELDAMQSGISAGAAEKIRELMSDLKMNCARIEKHGKRADGVVLSLLEHARTLPGMRRPTDLHDLIDDCVDLAYRNFQSQNENFSAKIEKVYEKNIGEIDVVPPELGRAFISLFNNAFYAIWARSQQTDDSYEPAVSISTEKNGTHVAVKIADNGEGVLEGTQDKIFEPFFSTKPTGMGMGLGLSLSYEIITRGYGGTLSVADDDRKGATFVVTLPLA